MLATALIRRARAVITFLFSLAVFPSLSKAMTAEPAPDLLLCLFFSIYQLLCSNHFAMSVFIFEVFIYNTVRIINNETRRFNSPQFSCLLTVLIV